MNELSEDERVAIGDALAAYRKSGAIPCTACGYCSTCPVGVDIPCNLAIYNQLRATDNLFFAKLIYDTFPEEIKASSCIACGACQPKCPQQIDIPAEMQTIADEFK